MNRNAQSGFNLVELMAVVVIIGIISSIAYPAYRESVRDSRRSECSASLAAAANSMERFYTVTGTYLGAATGGANTGTPAIASGTCPADGSDATYNITIAAATETTYSLRATPTGLQSDDECGSLSLTNTGLKGIIDAGAGLTWQDCW